VGAFNFDIGPEDVIKLIDCGLDAVRQSELLPNQNG